MPADQPSPPRAADAVPAPASAAPTSVRSVVAARVASADGRVRVVLQIVDAARAGLESEQIFDRPVAELSALRTDIVTNIATTLAAPVGAPEPGRINEE